MLKKLLAGACAALCVGVAGAQEAPKEINFGIISTEASQNLKGDWAPVLEALQKATGVKVNAFFASDYAGIIEGMRFNKVQIAWYGNKSAMEAVDRANGEIFAQVIMADGSLGYRSFLGVHKDSPYKTLDDVLKNSKSINFGIGDPNSTSGFLVPSYYIFAQNKIDPKTAFKTVRGANHEANILAVANKQVDAAVFASDTYERIEARQPELAKNVRKVWESPLIPSDPLVWRTDLNNDLKTKIRAFFLAYGQTGANAAAERANLIKLQFSGFRPSTNTQLNPVRKLELFKKKTKLEADTTIDAAEKAKQIEAIDKQLAALGN